MESGSSLSLVLPAFPVKSPNKLVKVLGSLPDEAERFSLLHLNGLCDTLAAITGLPAILTIVSDGLAYNDILGVSDEDVWRYSEALRAMASCNGCVNIRFTRLYDMLTDTVEGSTVNTDAEHFLKTAAWCRTEMEKHRPKDFDVLERLANDADTLTTYCGYKRFLLNEIPEDGLNHKQRDKRNARIAKEMLVRGKAFAELIKLRFSECTRLSVHASLDVGKVSIGMLPQNNSWLMTPWHGALVWEADGGCRMTHRADINEASHELVYKNGVSSYFREKNELFDWPGIDFEHLYPCGLIVRPTNSDNSSLRDVDMVRVRRLTETHSPVILRGFSDARDEPVFVAKASEFGKILPWQNNVIMKVRNERNPDPASTSQLSNEALPMHYDGIFKMSERVDEITGVKTKVSDPPRFQLFMCHAASPHGTGQTLFASSRLFFKYLPSKSWDVEKLSQIRWTCNSHGYFSHTMADLPLVIQHPSTGLPCLRYQQPWASYQTSYGYGSTVIDNGPQSLVPLIDDLLYDRRVCLHFEWEEGDVLASDNFEMHHTRTAFTSDDARELWRIHID
ncbi:hypothetical protein BAUCODRAFT_62190 [Baudoinia panamericana UAMH 10762]|uniref:TauD/TfdA-like domain-containing protein n=1 Tax=Baudoinia panamericana (strain UAMH 10762) TaxID=717646 RepID=M2NLM6_BAUPA|nr:uncharacterized protein BAUCODRAFT_62190 [Baudoinia panamericana UAMH 10762]EMD00395.1 hypothetical protein BAUCODRAFT_62190 [Baudoinia panamericana UAMH 10762]